MNYRKNSGLQLQNSTNQIEIPSSFMVVYVDPRSRKPSATRDHISARYELCEDLANLLTQTAADMQFSLGIDESDVLKRCYQGLLVEGSVVEPAEAQWVVCRLAELQGWALPLVFEP